MVPGVGGDNLAVGQVVDLLSYLGPVLAAAKLEREGLVHSDGEDSVKTSYQAVVNDDGPLPLHVLPPVLQARVGQLEGLQLGGAAPRGGGGGGGVGGGGGEAVGGRRGRRGGGGGGCGPGGQSRQRSAEGRHHRGRSGGGHIRSSKKVKNRTSRGYRSQDGRAVAGGAEAGRRDRGRLRRNRNL